MRLPDLADRVEMWHRWLDVEGAPSDPDITARIQMVLETRRALLGELERVKREAEREHSVGLEILKGQQADLERVKAENREVAQRVTTAAIMLSMLAEERDKALVRVGRLKEKLRQSRHETRTVGEDYQDLGRELQAVCDRAKDAEETANLAMEEGREKVQELMDRLYLAKMWLMGEGRRDLAEDMNFHGIE